LLEVTGVARDHRRNRAGAAAGGDGARQGLAASASTRLRATWAGQFAGGEAWVDAGMEQGFVGVDVADTNAISRASISKV
jgi:hypothetical protein